MVCITAHGILGENIGGNIWNLNVKSLSEGLRAIESQTRKLYRFLHSCDKKNIKFGIVINGENFNSAEPLDLEHLDNIKNSELALERENLKTIDIIPILEGADKDTLGILTTILGVILIIIGILLIGTPFGVPLILGGVALLAAGISALLTKPPKFEDFRDVSQGGRTSYLFSGPQNIIGEGGPVPVGYGRLLVGSQVIAAAYVIRDYNPKDDTFIRNDYGDLTVSVPKPAPAKGKIKAPIRGGIGDPNGRFHQGG